jgi:hypothetical protein
MPIIIRLMIYSMNQDMGKTHRSIVMYRSSISEHVKVNVPAKTTPSPLKVWGGKLVPPHRTLLIHYLAFCILHSSISPLLWWLRINMSVSFSQICEFIAKGKPTHPEYRDSDISSTGAKTVLVDFIRKNFKGVALAPSVVEPCMFTVSP